MDTPLPNTQINPPSEEQTKHLQDTWRRCLLMLSEKVSANDYSTWFLPIIPERIENNTLILLLPDEHVYNHIENNFVEPMRRTLDSVLGMDAKIGYVFPKLDETPEQIEHKKNIQIEKNRTQLLLEQKFNEVYEPTPLNTNYLFENFIEGKCNQMARSAGWAVAQKPGVTSFNPLMLYGGVGLGKTHLMQAVGNYIKQNSPEKRIIYVSVDKFTTQFVNSIKNNDLDTFKKYYEHADILLLDDIQFLIGKESTQETFFHIFNHLQQSNRQIIMTSDCAPNNLKGLAERLVSRFKWGMSADLQLPDMETRMAIVQRKLQEKDVIFPDDVIEYLIQNVDSNVRELEGVMNSLIHHLFNGIALSVDVAKQIIRNLVQNNFPRETNLDDVLKTVAEYFSVSIDELVGKSRKKEIVFARQMAMYIAKECTPNSLKAIGIMLGGRDHSTVIHAIQTVTELVKEKKEVKKIIDDLKNKVG